MQSIFINQLIIKMIQRQQTDKNGINIVKMIQSNIKNEITSKIKQLAGNKLLCLSSNKYYLNVIDSNELTYRIDSEEQIIYFAPLSVQLFGIDCKFKSFHSFIVVNRKLQWTLFVLRDKQAPHPLMTGSLPHNGSLSFNSQYSSQQQIHYLPQQKNSQDCQYSSHPIVINVHQTANRLIFILDNMQIHQLLFKDKHIKLFGSYINNQLQTSPIEVRSQLIYPQILTSSLLTNFYLPSRQTNTLIDSLLLPIAISQIMKTTTSKELFYQFFLVFQSITLNQKSNQFYSVYQLLFSPKQKLFLSGNQSLLNITTPYLGIYTLGSENQQVIVQTQNQIYLLESNSQKQVKIIQDQNLKFTNPFTVFEENSKSKSLVSVVRSNEVKNISNNEESYKLVKMSFKKEKGINFETIIQFRSSKQEPLLYFSNPANIDESYFFCSDYSLHKTKNFSNDDSQSVIFKDHSVTVEKAQAINLQPGTNMFYLNQNTGFSQNSLILTNSFVETHRIQYQHNLPIQLAKVVYLSLSGKQATIVLTSPLIGTLALSLSNRNSNEVNIKLNQRFKILSGYECLTICQSMKSCVTNEQVIFDLEQNKSGKYPSLTIGKIFESSTDYVERAIIFQKTGWYLLSLQDQVHVFEGKSEKSFKRKFIHCFGSHIKNMYKLNDVNVLGVELYENHREDMNVVDEKIGETSFGMYSLQVYVIKQDRMSLISKINYGSKSINSEYLNGNSSDDVSVQSDPVCFITHINTVPHWFTFIHQKLLIVSNEETHRYNTQKIQLSTHNFPSPFAQNKKLTLNPLINLSIQNKDNQQNQFLLQIQENNSQAVKLFIGSFSRKLLIKNFQEIKFSYESIVSPLNLTNQNVLLCALNVDQNERNKKLTILTQKNCYNLTLTNGKIPLLQTSLLTQNYLSLLFKLNLINGLNQYKGIEKIEGPIKILQKQNYDSKDSINKAILGKNSQSSQILLVNKFQVWYGIKNIGQKTINPISVYTKVNNEFLEFRNNLSVEELEQPEFMKLFSQKIPIIQIKYLSNKAIILLFEKQITILQTGENGSLVVKQQIPFANISSKNMHKKQHQIPNENQYASIKIIELLDSLSSTEVFLKDAEGRLYLLILDENNESYSIKFDRILEEDIMCITRTNFWDQPKIYVPLLANLNAIQTTHEIIVKKDSQLIIKDLSSGKEKSQYI